VTKSAHVFSVVVLVGGSLATGEITSHCARVTEVIAIIPNPLTGELKSSDKGLERGKTLLFFE